MHRMDARGRPYKILDLRIFVPAESELASQGAQRSDGSYEIIKSGRVREAGARYAHFTVWCVPSGGSLQTHLVYPGAQSGRLHP
jgi:hypothetical protein